VSARTAGIVGLGLIGGSLARELDRHGITVLGHDADTGILSRATRDGVIAGRLGDGLERAAEVDWFIIAVPVDRAIDVLHAAAPHLHQATLVTDVGSTKRSIVEAAGALDLGARFIGSHPFAGSHESGWAASRTGLFAGARVFLCPTAACADSTVLEARTLWRMCAADTEIIDAASHDRRLAWTSHLPQFLSSCLALALLDAGVPFADTGPGARSMLRLAASDPHVWSAIGADNADNLDAALQQCELAIARLRSALAGYADTCRSGGGDTDPTPFDPAPLAALLSRGSRYTTG
jgi:prephenate dehydrogenase